MPMNQSEGTFGSFSFLPPSRKIVSAMKPGPESARVRNRVKLQTAGLALVFALQIVGLCFCGPASGEAHGCCPPAPETDLPNGANFASLPEHAAKPCGPDGPGLRAVLRVGEPDATATPTVQAADPPAPLVRSIARGWTYLTGYVPFGWASSGRGPQILRI